MQCEQVHWTQEILNSPKNRPAIDADLVYAFGPPELLSENKYYSKLRVSYPHAILAGCSTAGDIFGNGITDDCILTTAVKFRSTKVRAYYAKNTNPEDSYAVGLNLAQQAAGHDLRHLFVLSDGIHVNGTQLVRGVSQGVLQGVPVSGGLAADSDRFSKTYVLGPHGAAEDLICLVAFYGENFIVNSGSVGGWDPFGPDRTVTRSAGSVVYELDGKPILELYKKYLGEYVEDLPASALLFPLSVRGTTGKKDLVRTILGINEAENSMQFAGDIPQGTRVRLMKANLGRLIDGAGNAAAEAKTGLNREASLALLISCVGRRLVLKQRSEEEISAVREAFAAQTCVAGFYSYGEISPRDGFIGCDLHNQTMTITAYAEIG